MPLTSLPARLVYACGHAALVSLPVVKGETARQRTERVQREKEAAQQRSCDFCAPVAVEAGLPSLQEVAANGHTTSEPADLIAAQVEVTEPVAVEPEPEPIQPQALVEPEAPAAAEPEPQHVAEPETAPARTTRRRRARAVRAAPAGLSFRVRFVVEDVVEATTVLNALAAAHARGATDVLSIVRLD